MPSKINALALIAFWLVVPGVMIAFSRLVPRRAALIILFSTVLFLPELLKFDFPLVPALDKDSLPVLLMTLAVLRVAKKEIKAAELGKGFDFLMPMALVSAFATVLANGDTLRYGPKVIKGQTMYDAVSFALETSMRVVLPYFLGRVLFRHAADAKDLLKSFTFYALLYSPLVLIELKMSPQMHTWIFGYRQHSWGQTMRGDGWRPQVFMEHGLALAIFICIAALAAGGLARIKERTVTWASAGAVATFLMLLLALLNSLGALIYGIVSIPMMWLLKPKGQLRFACFLALIIYAYPALRVTDIFPAQGIVTYVAESSPLRAQSLGWRFMNEDQVLEKAFQRPFFGWSGYARGHIWNEAGKNITTIDGAWLAMVSRGGLLEFSVYFSLLLVPVFVALRRVDKVPKANQPIFAAVGLMATVSAMDLLPNGVYNTFPLFISGALAGLVRGMPGETAGRVDASLIRRLEAALRAAGYLPAAEPQHAALTGGPTHSS